MFLLISYVWVPIHKNLDGRNPVQAVHRIPSPARRAPDFVAQPRSLNTIRDPATVRADEADDEWEETLN